MDVDQETLPGPYIVRKLAAHPLNSCNPPPLELPDLLDSLIASEGRLKVVLRNCTNVGKTIHERLQDLKQRIYHLEMSDPRAKKLDPSMQDTAERLKNAEETSYEIEVHVLRKMSLQVGFVHHVFTTKIHDAAMASLKAHQDLLTEFLGQRHDHLGIEVAHSTKLLCTPECVWYQQHGPYEWTKKPYSNTWWEEMNHTDWDWLRIKDHITSTITNSSGKVSAMYDIFHANATKFLPPWFWSNSFETWTLRGWIHTISGAGGGSDRLPMVTVRAEKTGSAIDLEKLATPSLVQQKPRPEPDIAKVVEAAQQGPCLLTDEETSTETVLAGQYVFDSVARMPATNGRGTRFVRWLTWWGIEKWTREISTERNALTVVHRKVYT